MNSINRTFFVSIGFTFLLILARFQFTGIHIFFFLLWNLFLAWIPLFFSYQLKVGAKYRIWNLLIFLGWLLFFPNSLYLVTDLVHLKQSSEAPEWFDIILLFSAVSNGLMMGYSSLIKIEIFLANYFRKSTVNLIVFGSFIISCFGVYLGRFLRWNSWDVLTKPTIILDQLGLRFTNPATHSRAILMTLVLSLFFGLFYLTIRKLPHRPGESTAPQ